MGQGHGDQILAEIQYQRDSQSRPQGGIFKIDEVAAVRSLQTFIAVRLLLPGRSEGKGLPVCKNQIAVVSVVKHQRELPAGQLINKGRTEHGQHSRKLIGLHKTTSGISSILYKIIQVSKCAVNSQIKQEPRHDSAQAEEKETAVLPCALRNLRPGAGTSPLHFSVLPGNARGLQGLPHLLSPYSEPNARDPFGSRVFCIF